MRYEHSAVSSRVYLVLDMAPLKPVSMQAAQCPPSTSALLPPQLSHKWHIFVISLGELTGAGAFREGALGAHQTVSPT